MREAYPMSTLTLDSFTFSYPSDTSHWGAWEPRPLASTTRSAASSSSLDSPWRCRRCTPVTRVVSSLAHSRVTSDRKSTRLNSSHVSISYAVFCLKKKNTNSTNTSIILDYTVVRQVLADILEVLR